MSAIDRRALGARWEERAEAFLRERGLHLLARNFLCRAGEIDLVMRDGEVTVFVEVRFRGPGARVGAAASVSRQKQWRIARAAGLYLSRHPRLAATPCRFDVVAFENEDAPRWIRNAFESPVV